MAMIGRFQSRVAFSSVFTGGSRRDSLISFHSDEATRGDFDSVTFIQLTHGIHHRHTHLLLLGVTV